MTEEKKFSIQYLDRESVRILHEVLSEYAEQGGEPIPPFECAKQGDIDALVNAPQREFYGVEAYPTLAEKAAIIFYTINKSQIFLNGNKRMSTLALLVFLAINGKRLDVHPDEMTEKALWLAKSASEDFQTIKIDLVHWIESHLRTRQDR